MIAEFVPPPEIDELISILKKGTMKSIKWGSGKNFLKKLEKTYILKVIFPFHQMGGWYTPNKLTEFDRGGSGIDPNLLNSGNYYSGNFGGLGVGYGIITSGSINLNGIASGSVGFNLISGWVASGQMYSNPNANASAPSMPSAPIWISPPGATIQPFNPQNSIEQQPKLKQNPFYKNYQDW